MKKKYLLLKKGWVLMLILISSFAFGATRTWNGSSSSDWSTRANWSENLVPTAADDVVIPTNITQQPIISTAAAVCRNLTIDKGATLTVGAPNLTVSGATSISGTIIFSSTSGAESFTGLVTVNNDGLWNNTANKAITFRGGITNKGRFNAGTGVQSFTNTVAQALNGDFKIPNVTVTGINLTNNNTLSISTALSGTGTLANAANAVLNIGGTSSITNLSNTGTTNIVGSGGSSTVLARFTNTGIINLNGTGNITGITNNAAGIVNLSSSGTITTFNNATATSLLNISDATPTITKLTATLAGNTVNYNGASQTVKGTIYSNLITSGSGIKTLSGAITVNNNLYLTSGTKLIDFEYQITGNNNGGKLTLEKNATLVLGKGFDYPIPTSPQNYNSTVTTFPTEYQKNNINLMEGSTVQYIDYITNGGTQLISTVPDYYNLVCEYPGKKTALSGTLNINGNFSTGANLDLSTYSPTINLKGDFFPGAAPITVSLTKNVFNIGGNFINNILSGGSLLPGTGTVVFNGSTAQSIEGTGKITTNFYNLIIDNTRGGVSIGISGANDDVAVTNTLTMTNGILTTSTTNLLNVTNTTIAAITGGSDTSFINGPVKWTTPLNDTYKFPVGKGATYLPFVLKTNANTGTTAQVEAFDIGSGGTANFTIPTVASTVGSLSTIEYWSLVTTGNFTTSVVSLSRPTTAITPLDLIAGSATVTGTYTSLSGTVGANGITASTAIGTNRFFVLGRKNGIRINGSITGSPFCAGSSVTVPFKITYPFTGTNVFTAQLSDAFGSFSSPVSIGSVLLTLDGKNDAQSYGTITTAEIPVGTAVGAKYRIRVVSSVPNVIGEDNGIDLTINNKPTLAAITAPTALCAGSSFNPTAPTVTANGSPVSSQGWEISTTSGGSTYTALTVPYNVAFADNGKNIRYTATNGCGTTYGNPVVVVVNPFPTAVSVTGNGQVCSGVDAVFTITGTPGNVVTYNINGGTNTSITIPVTGSAEVKVSAATANQVLNIVSVSNGTCVNTATSATTVIVGAVSTWSGGGWNNDGPPNNNNGLSAVIAADYTTSATKSFSACSCTVNSGATLTITKDTYVQVQNNITNNGTIVVESDGNLDQINDDAVNTGNIIVHREHTLSGDRKEYNFLSSPVKNQNMKLIFGNNAGNIPFVTVLKESTNAFINATAADYQKPARGFSVKEPIKTYSGVIAGYNGPPNNGKIAIDVTRSATNRGWNLIGNPYPSNLDLKKLYDDNANVIGNEFRFWDNKVNATYTQYGGSYNGYSYALYNAATGPDGFGNPAPGKDTGNNGTGTGTPTTGGGRLPYRVVKVSQAFMVRATNTPGPLNYKNAYRSISNESTTFFGKNSGVPESSFRLQLISPAHIIFTQGVVYFEGGNNTFGIEDSKHPAPSSSDAFYSFAGDEKVVINGRSIFNRNDVIKLGTQYYEAGLYKIKSVDQKGVFAQQQPIYIKDNLLNVITDISVHPYEFTSGSGAFTSRFEIVYEPEKVLVTDATVKITIQIYRDALDFVIKSSVKKITAFDLYDMSGRIIMSQKTNTKEIRFDAEKLVDGAYILKAQLEGGETVVKKIRK